MWWRIFLAVLTFMVVVAVVKNCHAHDEFFDWTAPDGETSCCNKTDCRVVRAYTDAEGRLMVDYPGAGPLYVPPQVHINRLHSSGKPVACYDIKSKIWYCFSQGAAM